MRRDPPGHRDHGPPLAQGPRPERRRRGGRDGGTVGVFPRERVAAIREYGVFLSGRMSDGRGIALPQPEYGARAAEGTFRARKADRLESVIELLFCPTVGAILGFFDKRFWERTEMHCRPWETNCGWWHEQRKRMQYRDSQNDRNR